VKEHKLVFKPAPEGSRLHFARSGISVERIGTAQLDAKFLFPAGSAEKGRTKNHWFEVFPIKDANTDYHFIIGMDLIPFLFGANVPVAYLPCSPSAVSGNELSQSVAALLISHTVDEDAASHQLDEIEDIEPKRPHVWTLEEHEQLYSSKRKELLADLSPAIETNTQVTGFCNMPESVVTLTIDEEQAGRLYRRQYKLAQRLKELADPIIQEWKATGKIELAAPGCRYNNAMTIVPKKDDAGQLTAARPCLDARALNKALRCDDKYQVPHIRDALFDALGGCSIFGSVDLFSAYLQLLLSASSRPLTAFTWDNQQYQFVGAPFGLKHLTSHFQRIMSRVFSDMPFVMAYVDNIIFGSKSWEEHRSHARMVIERLTHYNLKIKPSSIQLGHSQLHCLGHVLSVQGLSADEGRINSILAWQRPVTGKDMQRFLGFCVFVRQHIRHYADLTSPMEAVKNHATIEWDEQLITSFDLTKAAFAKSAVLVYPDFSLPFHIATDASQTGVGGILFQPRSAGEHITPTNMVAIVSKKLNDCQRKYSAYKKELFAIVFCLRKFHSFVYGRTDLVIHTDHKPLTYMNEVSNLAPALQQWLDVIQDYSFEIIHREGILNVLPDALSRMYGEAYSSSDTWGVNPRFPSAPPTDISIKALDLVDRGEREASAPSASSSSAASNLQVELEKRGKKSPSSDEEKQSMIAQEHAMGHFGVEAVYRKLYHKGWWWPQMRTMILQQLKSCDACARFTVVKSGFHPPQAITAKGPGDHIQIDTSVHLPQSPEGYTALLVCICVFTSFVFLRALKDTKAETVAAALWSIFCIIGIPVILQSDNGPEFANDVIRALIKLTGIEHRYISPYHPQADGKVERSIGTVTSIIKKMLNGTEMHWPLFVDFAQLSFNNKIATLTGSSPFALMFGRPLNELRDYTKDGEPITIDLNDWKAHQEKIASLIYPAISERIKSGKSKMLSDLQKHRKLLLPQAIPEKSSVMIKDPVRTTKFEPKYIGPYEIVRRARNGAYVLKDMTGDLLDRHVPVDQIKILQKAKRRKKDEEHPYFEVSRIISHRGEPGAYEYLVQWKGYSDDDNTWEPSSSFADVSVIHDYWRRNGPPSPSASSQ
jgi:transposase InsO family protein